MSTATVTSLDGFHATRSAQRADELVRSYFDAVNVEDPARINELLARSFLSYDVHGTRSRTGLKRYHADLRGSFSDPRFDVHENVGVLVEGRSGRAADDHHRNPRRRVRRGGRDR